MKTFIKILFFVLLTNLVKPQWELRYSADYSNQIISDGSKMYMGRTNGLTVYDSNTKKCNNLTTINSELPGNYINTLMPMPDNTILISTYGGLAVIENGIITKDKPICTSYPDNDARALYKDSRGNIWTFSSHKVHRYSNSSWITFDLSDSVTFRFDIARLFFHNDQCWALFNDNTKTETVFYYSDVSDEYLKIAVISDLGIIRTFQTTEEFPYRQGSVSLVSANDDVYLKNNDGIYFYHNSTWTNTNIFFDAPYKPFRYSGLYKDINNNLWTIVRDDLTRTAHPASYNISSGITTHHLTNEEDTNITSMTILDDGTILAYTNKNFYFYNDAGWTKVRATDYGIPDSVYFSSIRIVDGRRCVVITRSLKSEYKRGTIIWLDDGTMFSEHITDFPYITITQFGIKKDGKGMFKGRYSYNEPYQYETDSGFVEPDMVSNVSIIKPCMDGYVYYTSQRLSGPSGSTPFLTTWDGNELIKRDMGFIDEGAKITDFDGKDNYLIALGSYVYSFDSLFTYYSSYISLYNTTDGTLIKYDRNNSCLPDYYRYQEGLFGHLLDTVITSVAVDNDLNVWVFTWKSLIKFNPSDSKIFDIPIYDSTKNYHISLKSFNFDSKSNELVGFRNTNNSLFFFFDIATETWDSVAVTVSGFIGNYVTHKKLLDNNVWACDDLGYMYRYAGKGKFTPYNLRVNGKPNLGFRINDFSIDANNYLHLGTDIGLLTNKSILTSVEDNSLIETEKFSIIPNPATDFIKINYPESMETRNIEIYSILGIIVLETEYNDKIDVSGLSAGVYFVRSGNKVLRFVKL